MDGLDRTYEELYRVLSDPKKFAKLREAFQALRREVDRYAEAICKYSAVVLRQYGHPVDEGRLREVATLAALIATDVALVLSTAEDEERLRAMVRMIFNPAFIELMAQLELYAEDLKEVLGKKAEC